MQKAGLDLNTVMEVVTVADFRSPLLVSNGQNVLKSATFFLPSSRSSSCSRTRTLIENFAETRAVPHSRAACCRKAILKSAVALGFGERKRLRSN